MLSIGAASGNYQCGMCQHNTQHQHTTTATSGFCLTPCVWWDVKPCSINQSILFDQLCSVLTTVFPSRNVGLRYFTGCMLIIHWLLTLMTMFTVPSQQSLQEFAQVVFIMLNSTN